MDSSNQHSKTLDIKPGESMKKKVIPFGSSPSLSPKISSVKTFSEAVTGDKLATMVNAGTLGASSSLKPKASFNATKVVSGGETPPDAVKIASMVNPVKSFSEAVSGDKPSTMVNAGTLGASSSLNKPKASSNATKVVSGGETPPDAVKIASMVDPVQTFSEAVTGDKPSTMVNAGTLGASSNFKPKASFNATKVVSGSETPPDAVKIASMVDPVKTFSEAVTGIKPSMMVNAGTLEASSSLKPKASFNATKVVSGGETPPDAVKIASLVDPANSLLVHCMSALLKDFLSRWLSILFLKPHDGVSNLGENTESDPSSVASLGRQNTSNFDGRFGRPCKVKTGQTRSKTLFSAAASSRLITVSIMVLSFVANTQTVAASGEEEGQVLVDLVKPKFRSRDENAPAEHKPRKLFPRAKGDSVKDLSNPVFDITLQGAAGRALKKRKSKNGNKKPSGKKKKSKKGNEKPSGKKKTGNGNEKPSGKKKTGNGNKKSSEDEKSGSGNKKSSEDEKSGIDNNKSSEDEVCSADKFVDLGKDLKRSLEEASLPTLDLLTLVNFILAEEDTSSFIWGKHRIEKVPSSECRNTNHLEVVYTSKSRWCMNIDAARTAAPAGRRQAQESSPQLVATTCVLPTGSYSESCNSITYSTAPDPDGNCNLAACCNDITGSDFVWNTGKWQATTSGLELADNENGCMISGTSGSTEWDRTLCKKDACNPPPEVPPNCKATYFARLANEACSVTVSCVNPAGSTYLTTGVYNATSENLPLVLQLNETSYCVEGDGWGVADCRLACGTPGGSWVDATGCQGTLVSPYPENGKCSMSTSCNYASNRGTHSPIGSPPDLEVNENGCVTGPSEWSREFCGNPCPIPVGSYTDGCSSREYLGPDIKGTCYMQMTCKTEQGVTVNVVVYDPQADMNQLAFSLNDRGCLTAPDSTSQFWSRTYCEFYQYGFFANIVVGVAQWYDQLSTWEKVGIVVAIAIVSAGSCAATCFAEATGGTAAAAGEEATALYVSTLDAQIVSAVDASIVETEVEVAGEGFTGNVLEWANSLDQGSGSVVQYTPFF